MVVDSLAIFLLGNSNVRSNTGRAVILRWDGGTRASLGIGHLFECPARVRDSADCAVARQIVKSDVKASGRRFSGYYHVSYRGAHCHISRGPLHSIVRYPLEHP